MTVVVLRTRTADRASEALRAAIGLGLRGETVRVVLCAEPPDDPRVRRAISTLDALGRTPVPADQLVDSVRAAARVEVWT